MKYEVEISQDPFYAESNLRYLEKIVAEINAGTAKLSEHSLIETEKCGKGHYET